MTDPNNTGTNDQVPGAGGQPPVETPPETPPETTPEATPDASETRQVPLHVLQTVESKLRESDAERERLRAEAEEAARLRQQLELYKANPNFSYQQPQGQPPAQQPAPQEEPSFDDIDDDDMISGAQLKQVVRSFAAQPRSNAEIEEVRNELRNIRLAQMEPDYENVIKTHLPPLIQKFPHIAEDIRRSPDPLGTALRFAKVAQGTAPPPQEQPPPEPSFADQLSQIISNNDKPRSPSTVGSPTGVVSSANRFATMTREEFLKHKADVISGRV